MARNSMIGAPTWSRRRTTTLLFVLIVGSALARLGWAWYVASALPEALFSPDTASYLDAAEALVETGTFSETADSAEPMFIRTPGYPMFLAALQVIGIQSHRGIVFAQALLSGLLTWLVYRLGRQLGGRSQTGLLAAALCTLSPIVLWSTTSVLTEFVNAVFLALFLTCFISMADRGATQAGLTFAVAASAALAAATFVRPTTYYFALLLVPITVLALRTRRAPWRQCLSCVVAVLVPFCLAIGAWQVRNLRAVDSARFAGIEARSMYLYRAAGAVALQDNRPIGEVRAQLEDELGPRGADEAQGPYLDRMYARGLDLVLANPTAAAETSVRGLARSVFGINFVFDHSNLPRTAPLVGAMAASLLSLWTLAVLGAWRACRSAAARPAGIALAITVSYVLLISAGPESYSRFRAPIEPLLCVLAAFAAEPALRSIRTATLQVGARRAEKPARSPTPKADP